MCHPTELMSIFYYLVNQKSQNFRDLKFCMINEINEYRRDTISKSIKIFLTFPKTKKTTIFFEMNERELVIQWASSRNVRFQNPDMLEKLISEI